MTRFDKYVTALIAAISFGAAAIVEAPASRAFTTCTHDSLNGTFTCNGPHGTTRGTYDDFTGTSSWSGLYGTERCTHDRFIGTTSATEPTRSVGRAFCCVSQAKRLGSQGSAPRRSSLPASQGLCRDSRP